MELILFLAIGVAAGWIAGQIMKGRGFGLVGNMVVGVVGAFLGGHLLGLLGISGSGLIARSSSRWSVPSCCWRSWVS